MPRSAWAVEPREETGDGTESSAMLDRGSGPPGSRRYVIEGNTCLLRLYIARLIYHACFRPRVRGSRSADLEPAEHAEREGKLDIVACDNRGCRQTAMDQLASHGAFEGDHHQFLCR